MTTLENFGSKDINPEWIRKQLACSASSLPAQIFADGPSVMQSWTHTLPRRHQGVLATSIRGCDGAPKEDPSKALSRMIRRAILNPADDRETLKEGGFFGFSKDRLIRDFSAFVHSLDQYPLHYVMHLCHASEVIGYKHPSPQFRHFFQLAYRVIVHTFHLEPESEGAMDARLTHDRVIAGTTERNF